MAQKHYAQIGTFHITIKTWKGIPWCTLHGVPEILIDNLFMTRNIQQAKVFAFCVLPNHMHVLIEPGEKGLSAFMHSFKRNAMRDIRTTYGRRRSRSAPTIINDVKWQRNFHDRRMRTWQQRNATFAYVRHNAWRHGMTQETDDWPWSSIHYDHLRDPMEIWF